jgi:hypothetical protein
MPISIFPAQVTDEELDNLIQSDARLEDVPGVFRAGTEELDSIQSILTANGNALVALRRFSLLFIKIIIYCQLAVNYSFDDAFHSISIETTRCADRDYSLSSYEDSLTHRRQKENIEDAAYFKYINPTQVTMVRMHSLLNTVCLPYATYTLFLIEDINMVYVHTVIPRMRFIFTWISYILNLHGRSCIRNICRMRRSPLV